MATSDRLDALQERLLVLRVQSGDRAAFPELMALYDRKVAYYVRRMVSEPAAALDLCQEIWLKVFLRLPSLRAPEAFRVWLYRIAHDLTVVHWRKESRDRDREEQGAVPEEATWNEFELLEDAEYVHRRLGELPASRRDVLTLRFLEGLEIPEIAEIVGVPEGTVRSRLHYALAALRQHVSGDTHAQL